MEVSRLEQLFQRFAEPPGEAVVELLATLGPLMAGALAALGVGKVLEPLADELPERSLATTQLCELDRYRLVAVAVELAQACGDPVEVMHQPAVRRQRTAYLLDRADREL